MTCKEKLKEMHPDWDENVINGQTMSYCPFELGINYPPGQACTHTTCKHCWNHEIPEERGDDKVIYAHIPGNNVEEDHAVDVKVEPVIKDSGDRTEFETGAVRDMREGKGRCDLMPLKVVGNFICDSNDDTDDVLWALGEFQKTNSVSYLYSALEAFNVKCYDNCYTMMLEVAKHFEEGAKKYGESNWQKGIPVHCYIDSAIRHYLKWLRGDKDEPHDRAFVWNLMCCIWEVDHRDKETK